MRTKDFSKTPAYAQGRAAFYGATRYKLRGLLILPWKWFWLSRTLHKAPGFLKLILWYQFPTTVGSVVFFTDNDALTKFAREPTHREVMFWVGDPEEKTSDAGFIRFLDVQESGYANGRWSTEDRMDHIKTFSRLPGEDESLSVTRPGSAEDQQQSLREPSEEVRA